MAANVIKDAVRRNDVWVLLRAAKPADSQGDWSKCRRDTLTW
jgi:hypothetical protein